MPISGDGQEAAASLECGGAPPPSISAGATAARTGKGGGGRRQGLKGSAFVLGFELLESIAFSGVALNLVVYLGTVLHGATAFNAAHVDTWNGTTFIVPVVGAFLADSCWGKYNTIVASLLFYLAGMVLLTLSAAISPLRPAPCQGVSCPPATGAQFSVFFAALYLTSVGTGGVKSALLPFGAEQYDESCPEEARRKQSFFTWFFGAINLGIFVAGTLVSWLQQSVSWALGFGVGTLCLLLAAAGFLAGTPWYRAEQLPAGSPLRDILRVLVASLRKRKAKLPPHHGGLHELEDDGDGQRLAHTEGLRWLDRAAAVEDGGGGGGGPWDLCTVSEVEGLKVLARMAPIWATCVLYAASLGQMTTTFIQQGMAMDDKLFGEVRVPVASMVSVEVAFMLVWVLLHDAAMMPLSRRLLAGGGGLSQLQRMGVGRFLVVLAMATAALVERRRLAAAAVAAAGGGGRRMGIAWQVPQFVLVAGSDVFCGIAQLEFFYGEAPASMRSICSALSFLAMSLGFYANSAVVTAVAAAAPGWLAPDLDKGHLDYYFWLWAAIAAGNLLLYMLLAARYTPKQVLRRHPSRPS